MASIVLGYTWTTVTARLENVESKVQGLSAKMDQLQLCQQAKGHALVNKDRIEQATERVSELESLLSDCAEKLKKHKCD